MMSNIIPMKNKRDWKYHADRINAAWGKQVDSILETGRFLMEAQDDLDKHAFEAMCKTKLSFPQPTASRLMIIAKKPVFYAHVHKTPIPLPASWGTLYELSKLDDAVLRAKIKDGTIHSKLERADAVRLVKELRGPSLFERVRDAFDAAKNGLTYEELHRRIGGNVAAHTMRGYVSKLAKTGELNPTGEQRKVASGNLAMVYAPNEDYRPVAARKKPAKTETPTPPQSEPQAQRDEMRRSYVTFLQTLTKEEQVDEIKKIIRRELGWTTNEISALYPSVRIKL